MLSTDELNTPYNLGEAAGRTVIYMPYLQSYICCLVPVERPGIGGLAADPYMRLYYDPKYFETHTLDEACFWLLHCVLHGLCQDHVRGQLILGDTPPQALQVLWHMAADFAINSTLLEVVGAYDNRALPVPEEALRPGNHLLPDGLATEDYYAQLLTAARQKQADSPEGMSLDDAVDQMLQDMNIQAKGIPDHGSCVDGIARPWDEGDPGESGTPGYSADQQATLQQQVAQAIETAAKGEGKVPGGLQRWADSMIRPVRNPYQELANLVAVNAAMRHGTGNFSFKKLARRQPPLQIRLPAAMQTLPRVIVIVDTSGSMSQHDLGVAMGAVQQGLTTVPDNCLTVMAGDTECTEVQRVFRTQDVKLLGGGGTDMATIIEQAAQLRPRPDLIICVTDGLTGWPEHRPGRVRVIAALTQATANVQMPPGWIQTMSLV